MTETTHGMVLATSEPEGDTVTLVGENHDSVTLSKDQLIELAAAHAAKWAHPRLGQSVYRSIDAQLVGMQAQVSAARADRGLPYSLAESIALYALRYALGRQTYAPGDVQAAIRTLLPIRHAGTREAMVREIEEAAGRPGGLGDPRMDQPGWLALLARLR